MRSILKLISCSVFLLVSMGSAGFAAAEPRDVSIPGFTTALLTDPEGAGLLREAARLDGAPRRRKGTGRSNGISSNCPKK